MKVEAFKKLAEERLGIPCDKQRLIFGGKQFEDGKQLVNYSGFGNNATIFLVLRLPGGGLTESRPFHENVKRYRPQSAPSHDEECTICFEKGESMQMPCSHPFCPACLMNYAWSEVSSNHKTAICCCICSEEWPIGIVQQYGSISDEEMKLLQQGLSKNFIISSNDIKECPGCQSYCERSDTSNNNVHCFVCAKKGASSNFCWHCLRKWKNGSNTKECGNAACNDASLVEMLKAAPLIHFDYLSPNIKAPSKRACVTCGIIIEHGGQCKHMKCIECKTEFCFICLRKRIEGSWQCGLFNSECSPAPVQLRIPRRNNT